MKMQTVDIIIPTYRPNRGLDELLRRLTLQTFLPTHIYIVNTEERFWNAELEKKYPQIEVTHIARSEFDHGGTRKRMAEKSNADILVFMTQDAMPKDSYLLEELVKTLEEPGVGAAYARQLPKKDCQLAERYTRSFNYPEEGRVKSKSDLEQLGIKTFFCSNVCSAYNRKIYEEMGGFVERTIFNEDMIFARKLIDQGYKIVYQPKAQVYHSHNYRAGQQFQRNFDLGVSHAEYRESFSDVSSEGEGIKMVKNTIVYLLSQRKPWLIPQVFVQSVCKYLGYLLGKHYLFLPKKMVVFCSMNKGYWDKK